MRNHGQIRQFATQTVDFCSGDILDATKILDKLILDFPKVQHWVNEHNGTIELDNYKTALPRSATVFFCGDFEDVLEFLKLDGVRRALIAYWNEALITISEQDKLSAYARCHNYNAVAKIVEAMGRI